MSDILIYDVVTGGISELSYKGAQVPDVLDSWAAYIEAQHELQAAGLFTDTEIPIVMVSEDLVQWVHIYQATYTAVNSAYGTDERHGQIARAVANAAVYNRPVPWSMGKYFGRI